MLNQKVKLGGMLRGTVRGESVTMVSVHDGVGRGAWGGRRVFERSCADAQALDMKIALKMT